MARRSLELARMWTMLRLSSRQRAMVADKLLDGANVAAGAMIFGQFVAGRRFLPSVAVLGLGIWVVLVLCAMALSKETP